MDQHVCRFHVPVNNSVRMSVPERLGDAAKDVRRGANLNLSSRSNSDPIPKGGAGTQLHGDVQGIRPPQRSRRSRRRPHFGVANPGLLILTTSGKKTRRAAGDPPRLRIVRGFFREFVRVIRVGPSVIGNYERVPPGECSRGERGLGRTRTHAMTFPIRRGANRRKLRPPRLDPRCVVLDDVRVVHERQSPRLPQQLLVQALERVVLGPGRHRRLEVDFLHRNCAIVQATNRTDHAAETPFAQTSHLVVMSLVRRHEPH
mmetsp:Transcript_1422/g.6197  ORF Transcript_1422/g.6197 Transcript_1422/m.6197 type:complete len:259 (-) Transcript_1422:599-1375(-)